MQEYYLNSEKKICLMELSEFKELEGAYPHKRNLFRSMNPVQYCKAESYGDCLFGTMKIPRALKGRVTYIVFGFYLRGEELHLTPIEYKLLCLLSRNVGKVLTHTFITQQIWNRSAESDVASLRVFMATLRKKLETEKSDVSYIQTHVGIGYRMLRIE